MTTYITGLDMAVRNANDAISMIQTADGALIEMTNMLQRMRELAVQASSGTYSATDRDALNVEFEALTAAVEDIMTILNGMALVYLMVQVHFHSTWVPTRVKQYR